ncbi:MAG: hypothetical protein ACYTBZ_16685 [Planctomycetota bacterium]
MIAAIDWPVLVFAGIILLLIVTWGAYKRLARAVNTSLATGDIEGSLEAALKLQRSRQPIALLERLINPGQPELLIANRYYEMLRLDEALNWCQKGLPIARKPATKGALHIISALTHADRNQYDQCEVHLSALKQIQQGDQHIEIPADWVAIYCLLQTGQLDKALAKLNDVLGRIDGPLPIILFNYLLHILAALGRFDDLFNLTASISTGPNTDKSIADRHDPARKSLGLDKVHQAQTRKIVLDNIIVALSAAKDAQRWDLFEQYLHVLEEVDCIPLSTEVMLLGYRAILAAHCGDREGLIDYFASIDALIRIRCPNDNRIKASRHQLAANAWQLLGEHERALNELASLHSITIPPLQQSELAALAANSLEALGQVDKARTQRSEARQLAPLACWNQPAANLAEHDGIIQTIFVRISEYIGQTQQPDVTISGISPVKPVASGMACAAWIVALPAMVPLIGSLAGIALFVLSIVLLAKRNPLLHDRRVGWAGLFIALCSIGFATTAVVNYIALLLADNKIEYMNTPEPATAPATQEAFGNSSDIIVSPSDEIAERQAVEDDTSFDFDITWTQTILILVVLIISIMFHEIGHGLAAYWSGDPTARNQGRFSLNPLHHLDLFGSVILPVLLVLLPGDVVIGWAKPVPINPLRFRHQRRGLLGVTLAGVSLNILLAFMAANILAMILIVLIRFYPDTYIDRTVLLPFAPITLPNVPNPTIWIMDIEICKITILINSLLACFNLLPFPPLDGFGLLRAIAPKSLATVLSKMSGLGMILLLCMIAFDILQWLLLPAVLLAMVLLVLAGLLAGF